MTNPFWARRIGSRMRRGIGMLVLGVFLGVGVLGDGLTVVAEEGVGDSGNLILDVGQETENSEQAEPSSYAEALEDRQINADDTHSTSPQASSGQADFIDNESSLDSEVTTEEEGLEGGESDEGLEGSEGDDGLENTESSEGAEGGESEEENFDDVQGSGSNDVLTEVEDDIGEQTEDETDDMDAYSPTSESLAEDFDSDEGNLVDAEVGADSEVTPPSDLAVEHPPLSGGQTRDDSADVVDVPLTRAELKEQRKQAKKSVQSFALRAGVELSAAAEAALVEKIEELADVSLQVAVEPLISADFTDDADTEKNELELIDGVNEVAAEGFAQRLEEDLTEVEREAIAWAEPDFLFALPDSIGVDENEDVAVLSNDPRFEEQWGLQFIAGEEPLPQPATADSAASLFDRAIVAVIDTGIDYNHEDLVGQFWTDPDCVDEDGYVIPGGCLHGGYDFVDNDTDPFPSDGYTHATSVAGIIAAKTDNALGMASLGDGSVAIMSLRACCSKEGYFRSGEIARAIHFAVRNGADVINASFGGPTYSQQLFEAFQFAEEHGVLVVTAAGNYGSDNDQTPIYPANFDLKNILSVAALDASGALASFSNVGNDTVDIAAPGFQVLSTQPHDVYALVSGTSFAAPFVASLAGHYVFQNLHMTLEEMDMLVKIKTQLFERATSLDGLEDSVVGGRALTLVDRSAELPEEPEEELPPEDVPEEPMGPELPEQYRDRVTHEVIQRADGSEEVRYFYWLRGLSEPQIDTDGTDFADTLSKPNSGEVQVASSTPEPAEGLAADSDEDRVGGDLEVTPPSLATLGTSPLDPPSPSATEGFAGGLNLSADEDVAISFLEDRLDLLSFDSAQGDGQFDGAHHRQYLKFGDRYYGPIETDEDVSLLAVEFDDVSDEQRLQEMETAVELLAESDEAFHAFVTAGGVVGVEQMQARNEYTKVQKMVDGQYYAEMSLTPQFFRNNDGQYWAVNADIHDLNIPVTIPQDRIILSAAQSEKYLLPQNAPSQRSQYDYGVLASNVKYLFRDEGEEYAYVLTEMGEESFLHFVPLGIARGMRAGFVAYENVTGSYEGNSVTFAELSPGVSHRHTLMGNVRQQTITLDGIPEQVVENETLGFGATLELPYEARIFVDNVEQTEDFIPTAPVEVRMRGEVFELSLPAVSDMSDKPYADSARYRFERLRGNEWLVSVEVDPAFLLNPETQYPVNILTTTKLRLASDPLGASLQADNGADPNRQSNCQYTAVDVLTGVGHVDMRDEKNTFSNALDSGKLSFKAGMWHDTGTNAKYYKKGIVGFDLGKLPGFRNATNISNGQLLLWHNGAIAFPSGGLPFGIKKITNSFSCDSSKWSNLDVASSWTGSSRTVKSTPPSGNIFYYSITSDLANWAASGTDHYGYVVDITNIDSWSSGQSFIMMTDYSGTQRYPHLRVVYTPESPTEAKPDLTPYALSGWEAPVVLRPNSRSTPGGTSVRTVDQGEMFHIDFARRNIGTADSAWDKTYVRIGGVDKANCNAAIAAGNVKYCTVEARIDDPGTYKVELFVDADNHADESNENNNYYDAGYITVNAAELPDLVPANQPLTIRNAAGDEVSTIEFGEEIQIEAVWQNTANVDAGAHTTKVYLGNTEIHRCPRLSGLVAHGVAFCERPSYVLDSSIRPGTYELKLRVDSQGTINVGQVAEANEDNNDIILGTFTIIPNINLAPWTPDGWTENLLAANSPSTNQSSPNFEVSQPFYVSFGYQNTGSGDVGLTFSELKLGNQNIKVFQRSLGAQETVFERNYSFPPLSVPGDYQLNVQLDYDNQKPEASESDNALTKSITVLSAAESNVLKVTGVSRTTFVAGLSYDFSIYGAKFLTTSGQPNVTEVTIAGEPAQFAILSAVELRIEDFILPAGGNQDIIVRNAVDEAALMRQFVLEDNASAGVPDLALQNVRVYSDEANTKNWHSGALHGEFQVVNLGGAEATDVRAEVRLCEEQDCSSAVQFHGNYAFASLASSEQTLTKTFTITQFPSWFTVGSDAFVEIRLPSVAGELRKDNNGVTMPITRHMDSLTVREAECAAVTVQSILLKSPEYTAGENYAELMGDVRLFFEGVEKGEVDGEVASEVAGNLAERLDAYSSRGVSLQSSGVLEKLGGALDSIEACSIQHTDTSLPAAESLEGNSDDGGDLAGGEVGTGSGVTPPSLATLGTSPLVPPSPPATEGFAGGQLAELIREIQYGARDDEDNLFVAQSEQQSYLQGLMPQEVALLGVSQADLVTGETFSDADWLASVSQTGFTGGAGVAALAAELEYDPVAIYAFVQDEIRQLPYRGTVQGAAGCLSSRRCNDADTAHLLVGLLRSAGIPARYRVQELRLSEQRLKEMFAVSDIINLPEGYRAAFTAQANGWVTLPLVMAEGYMPVSASLGGAIEAETIDLELTEQTTNADVRAAFDAAETPRVWLPLLPIDQRLTVAAAEYSITEESFMDNFAQGYVSLAAAESPLDSVRSRLGTPENYEPSVTLVGADLGGVLPLGVPGYFTGAATTVVDLGESPSVVVELKNAAGQSVFSADAPLDSEHPTGLSGEFSLTYTGATEADTEYIAEKGSLFLTEPQNVLIVPVLLRDGEEISRGTQPLEVYVELDLTLQVVKGGVTLVEEGVDVYAGADLGIAAVTGFAVSDPAAHLSEGLSTVAYEYLARTLEDRDKLAALYQQSYLPSAGVAVVSDRLEPLYFEGELLSVDLTGYFLAGSLRDETFGLERVLLAEEVDQLSDFFELSELYYSTQTLEELAAMTVVSPLRVLQKAGTTGVEVDYFRTLADAYYGGGDLPVVFRNVVDELLLNGYEVYLTRGKVVFDEAEYVAYVARDKATGELYGQHFGVEGGILAQGNPYEDMFDMVKGMFTNSLQPGSGSCEPVCVMRTVPHQGDNPPLLDEEDLCYTEDDEFVKYSLEHGRYSISVDRLVGSGWIGGDLGTVSEDSIKDYKDLLDSSRKYCLDAGVPIRDRRNYTFGEVDHAFWQWSDGGKFESEDKGYSKVSSAAELKNLVSARGESVDDSFSIIPDIQLGTFYYRAGKACPDWQWGCTEERYYYVPPKAYTNVSPEKAVLLDGDLERVMRSDDSLDLNVRNALTRHGYGLHGWLEEDYESVNSTLGSFLGFPVKDVALKNYHSDKFLNSYVVEFLSRQETIGGAIYCRGEEYTASPVVDNSILENGDCDDERILFGKWESQYGNSIADMEEINLSATQNNLLTQRIIDTSGLSYALTYNLSDKNIGYQDLGNDLLQIIANWQIASEEEKDSLKAGILTTWIEQGESRLIFAAGFGAAGTIALPKLLSFVSKRLAKKLVLQETPIIGWVVKGLNVIQLINFDWESVNRCRNPEDHIGEDGLIDGQISTFYCGRAVGELMLVVGESVTASATAKGTLSVRKGLVGAQNSFWDAVFTSFPENKAQEVTHIIRRELKDSQTLRDEFFKLGELDGSLQLDILKKTDVKEISDYLKSHPNSKGKLPEFFDSGNYSGRIAWKPDVDYFSNILYGGTNPKYAGKYVNEFEMYHLGSDGFDAPLAIQDGVTKHGFYRVNDSVDEFMEAVQKYQDWDMSSTIYPVDIDGGQDLGELIFVLKQNREIVMSPRRTATLIDGQWYAKHGFWEAIPHPLLADGESVVTAGVIRPKTASDGSQYFEIENSSGHFKPNFESLESAKEILEEKTDYTIKTKRHPGT